MPASPMDFSVGDIFGMHQRMSAKNEAPSDHEELFEEENEVPPSAWLVAPYFFMYFTMYMINTVVWPLQLLERSCIKLAPEELASNFRYSKSTNSCITNYLDSQPYGDHYVATAYSMTLLPMIAVTFVSGAISLLSYFLIWKPLLMNFRAWALFVPPATMVLQSVLLMHSETVADYDSYKYMVLSGIVLPSLHGGFQGIFLMFFHMSKPPELKVQRELVNTSLDGSHAMVFLSMVFAGLFVSGVFDMLYGFVFFFQITLASVNVMYGLALLPVDNSFMSGDEKEKSDKDTKNDGDHDDDDDDDSDASVDEFLLADIVKQRKEGSMWSRQVNLLKEAPMIFTETSYKMELILVIEVCVFTIAILSDMDVSVLFFLETPFQLDLRVFGLCIAAQGVTKGIGMFTAKVAIRYRQIKHGTLITLALINYIIYYVMLSFASTKVVVVFAMLINPFGGLAFPSIHSYIRINFRDTADTVMEISMVTSFLVAMVFNGIKLLVYEKTRALFPGAVFAFTASLLALCGIGIAGTYFSTSEKHQRKSKHFADKLMNSEQ